jgi:tRNA U55 pseudouridine synthase TruB
MHPLDEALLEFEAVIADPIIVKQIQNGQLLECGYLASTRLCRVYSTQGEIVALLERDETAGGWRPKKVFMNL